jgi:hypothetical protein
MTGLVVLHLSETSQFGKRYGSARYRRRSTYLLGRLYPMHWQQKITKLVDTYQSLAFVAYVGVPKRTYIML